MLVAWLDRHVHNEECIQQAKEQNKAKNGLDAQSFRKEQGHEMGMLEEWESASKWAWYCPLQVQSALKATRRPTTDPWGRSRQQKTEIASDKNVLKVVPLLDQPAGSIYCMCMWQCFNFLYVIKHFHIPPLSILCQYVLPLKCWTDNGRLIVLSIQ